MAFRTKELLLESQINHYNFTRMNAVQNCIKPVKEQDLKQQFQKLFADLEANFAVFSKPVRL